MKSGFPDLLRSASAQKTRTRKETSLKCNTTWPLPKAFSLLECSKIIPTAESKLRLLTVPSFLVFGIQINLKLYPLVFKALFSLWKEKKFHTVK